MVVQRPQGEERGKAAQSQPSPAPPCPHPAPPTSSSALHCSQPSSPTCRAAPCSSGAAPRGLAARQCSTSRYPQEAVSSLFHPHPPILMLRALVCVWGLGFRPVYTQFEAAGVGDVLPTFMVLQSGYTDAVLRWSCGSASIFNMFTMQQLHIK
jgi:hypothetical protein